MRDLPDTRPHGDGWPPAWQPQPGDVLTGVIDGFVIGQTPHGPVRTVIVSEEPRGERVSLWLSSTSLLSLFAQHQPKPGERISVRYRWGDRGKAYSRWMLHVDRLDALDFSPLGGEASDEAPWHRERGVAVERLALADTVLPGKASDRPRATPNDLVYSGAAVRLATSRAVAWVHQLTTQLRVTVLRCLF